MVTTLVLNICQPIFQEQDILTKSFLTRCRTSVTHIDIALLAVTESITTIEGINTNMNTFGLKTSDNNTSNEALYTLVYMYT